jgi:hypothetical protein
MCVNGKMRPVETIPRIGGRKDKRKMMEGVNSTTIYLIYCKNFYKCHNVPPAQKFLKNTVFIRCQMGPRTHSGFGLEAMHVTFRQRICLHFDDILRLCGRLNLKVTD